MKAGMYSVPIAGQKEGKKQYVFDIRKDFFDKIEESEIKDSDIRVEVTVQKRSAHLELVIFIKGRVMIMCDRCLEYYWQETESNNRLILKFGDAYKEIDDELIMIPYGESRFDMSQYIYEFTHLSLPMQRIHPLDTGGRSQCNPLMLEKLRGNQADCDDNIDPRWSDLGKIKDDLRN